MAPPLPAAGIPPSTNGDRRVRAPARALVTGGAGFVGSHVAEALAARGTEVVVVDNLSRAASMGATAGRRAQEAAAHNIRHLGRVRGVTVERGDVRDGQAMARLARECDAVVHLAAQVAVTSSVADPRRDFEANALGTFQVLEAARRGDVDAVVAASTNKVYGTNVNALAVAEGPTRYGFAEEPARTHGVPETLGVDLCGHSPYGTSKLAGDLYAQDYAHTYGLRTGVFRMSCIYGPRQFGNEDQGWLAHFLLSTLDGRPITIHGDGKQVRDVLHVDDLVQAYLAFLGSDLRHGVWNVGGGPDHTTSLLELLHLAEQATGQRSRLAFGPWRPADQRVYVSDIRRARADLGWEPRIGLEEGVRRFLAWAVATVPAPAR